MIFFGIVLKFIWRKNMDFILNNWNNQDLENLIKYLQTQKDENYKIFNDRIVNTKSKTIGVRTPILRKVSKEISKGNALEFLNLKFPNKPQIFELEIIYGLVLASIKNVDISLPLFEKFINRIDNWAVCDILCGDYKIVNNNKEIYLNKIKEYTKSNNEFVVRVGLILLMKYYINTNIDDILTIISNVDNDAYYVDMGIAWLLSMCYIKHPTLILDYIKDSTLNVFTKRMTYQKIIDSLQVSKDEKTYIKELKRNLHKD